VSVKLTPEICMNKASSNIMLTAAGRWATGSNSCSQNCLQTLFFLSSFNETNRTTPSCWKTYLICIVFELGTLCGVLFILCFVLICFVLLFSPLMRQWQNYFWDTISRIGGWGTNTKIIKIETLLPLNLEIFFYFIYLFTDLFSIQSLSL
jgi:hypothetical protein